MKSDLLGVFGGKKRLFYWIVNETVPIFYTNAPQFAINKTVPIFMKACFSSQISANLLLEQKSAEKALTNG